MSEDNILVEDTKEEIKDEWRVKLQNFQSIVKGEITIPNGLTLVTGDSNQGKTAIFRGIDCSIFNTGTDDLVKAGNKIAGVTISNGKHEMVYCRNAQGKNEKTAYQFDGGTVQRKVGRSQLPEVLNMFGIREVRMQNGVKMKLNFWYQNDKPFLTDKTSGQLYEFLSLSSCDKYVKVLKQMITDIKVQEADINNANIRIDTLKVINNRKQEYIDANAGFDDIYKRVIVASNNASKVNKHLELLDSISIISKDINATKGMLRSVTDKLSSIDIKGISDKYQKMEELDNFYSDMYKRLKEIKTLKDEIESDKGKLKSVSEKYSEYSRVASDLSSKMSIVDNNIKYNQLYDLALECKGYITEIDEIKNRIISLESGMIDTDSIAKRLDTLEGKEAYYIGLNRFLTEIGIVKLDIGDVSYKIQETNDKLREAEKDLEDYKLEVGYCPFCGSVFKDCEH